MYACACATRKSFTPGRLVTAGSDLLTVCARLSQRKPPRLVTGDDFKSALSAYPEGSFPAYQLTLKAAFRPTTRQGIKETRHASLQPSPHDSASC